MARRVLDPEARAIASVEELFETPESPRVGRGYARLFEEVRLLQAAVEDDGARLVLMLFPDADQVGPRPHQPVPQERLRACAGMEGLLLVESDEERWRAARALAKLGPVAASAVGSLSRALDEDDVKLRREAALGLARIGASAEAALPRLVAARHDADPAVRDAAEKAIRRITASR